MKASRTFATISCAIQHKLHRSKPCRGYCGSRKLWVTEPAAQGMEKPNVAPGPSFPVAHSCPLWLSMIETTDRQTDAQTLRFGRIERLEQFLDPAWIQADAGVSNQQFDPVVAVAFRLESQRSWPIIDAGHRISRVQQQVQNQLMDLKSEDSVVSGGRYDGIYASRSG